MLLPLCFFLDEGLSNNMKVLRAPLFTILVSIVIIYVSTINGSTIYCANEGTSVPATLSEGLSTYKYLTSAGITGGGVVASSLKSSPPFVKLATIAAGGVIGAGLALAGNIAYGANPTMLQSLHPSRPSNSKLTIPGDTKQSVSALLLLTTENFHRFKKYFSPFFIFLFIRLFIVPIGYGCLQDALTLRYPQDL